MLFYNLQQLLNIRWSMCNINPVSLSDYQDFFPVDLRENSISFEPKNSISFEPIGLKIAKNQESLRGDESHITMQAIDSITRDARIRMVKTPPPITPSSIKIDWLLPDKIHRSGPFYTAIPVLFESIAIKNDFLTYPSLQGYTMATFSYQPYQCAWENLKTAVTLKKVAFAASDKLAFKNLNQPLTFCKRVKHFIAGAILCLPVINVIAMLALRILNSKVKLPQHEGSSPIEFDFNKPLDPKVQLFDSTLPTVEFHKETEPKTGIFSNFWVGKPLQMAKNDQLPKTVSSENIFQALKVFAFTGDVYNTTLFQLLSAPKPDVARNMAKSKNVSTRAQNEGNWAKAVDPSKVSQEYRALVLQHFDYLQRTNRRVEDWSGRPANIKDVAVFTKQDAAMLYALRRKGDGNPDFQQALKNTGGSRLVEATHMAGYKDYVWGDGPSKCGQNRLGLALMLYRAELCNQITPMPDGQLLYIIRT